MKIALIGYGKMGKAIENIALERGHTVPLAISSSNLDDLTIENLKNCDVAIEFSRPESAKHNILKCFEAGTPVAVGTTGWYHDYEEVLQQAVQSNGCLLATTNFSIGVNIFFAVNEQLAKLMANRSDYAAEIQEIHHTEKLDSPSGTAITLAKAAIQDSNTYSSWVNESTENKEELEIISYREAGVPGTHEVIYDSEIDKISIKHEAKSRKGFALGSVLAAEFIYKKTGIFSMKDVLTK